MSDFVLNIPEGSGIEISEDLYERLATDGRIELYGTMTILPGDEIPEGGRE